MANNALQIIQRVTRVMPVTDKPTTIVGVDDPQVANLVELLNDVGSEITSRHDWDAMGKKFAFPSTAENPQAVPLPEDWEKAFPDASVWRSGSNLVPLSGPCPNDAWHRLLTLPGVRFPGYWRLFAGKMEIIGSPAGEVISIEYVRNGWILDPDDNSVKTEVTKDGDTFLLPSELLRLGVIYKWRSSKGLSYAEEKQAFEYRLELDIAADRTARPISTTWPYNPSAPLDSWPGLIVPTNPG